VIDLDETLAVGGSPELVKRITRPRAIKILALLLEAREVIINTHPEPDTVRAVYNSAWMKDIAHREPEIIDPNGTIRFLQKIDGIFVELGMDENPAPADEAPPDFNETPEEEADRETSPDTNNPDNL